MVLASGGRPDRTAVFEQPPIQKRNFKVTTVSLHLCRVNPCHQSDSRMLDSNRSPTVACIQIFPLKVQNVRLKRGRGGNEDAVRIPTLWLLFRCDIIINRRCLHLNRNSALVSMYVSGAALAAPCSVSHADNKASWRPKPSPINTACYHLLLKGATYWAFIWDYNSRHVMCADKWCFRLPLCFGERKGGDRTENWQIPL